MKIVAVLRKNKAQNVKSPRGKLVDTDASFSNDKRTKTRNCHNRAPSADLVKISAKLTLSVTLTVYWKRPRTMSKSVTALSAKKWRSRCVQTQKICGRLRRTDGASDFDFVRRGFDVRLRHTKLRRWRAGRPVSDARGVFTTHLIGEDGDFVRSRLLRLILTRVLQAPHQSVTKMTQKQGSRARACIVDVRFHRRCPSPRRRRSICYAKQRDTSPSCPNFLLKRETIFQKHRQNTTKRPKNCNTSLPFVIFVHSKR